MKREEIPATIALRYYPQLKDRTEELVREIQEYGLRMYNDGLTDAKDIRGKDEEGTVRCHCRKD